MTEEKLQKALEIKQEIANLNHFQGMLVRWFQSKPIVFKITEELNNPDGNLAVNNILFSYTYQSPYMGGIPEKDQSTIMTTINGLIQEKEKELADL